MMEEGDKNFSAKMEAMVKEMESHLGVAVPLILINWSLICSFSACIVLCRANRVLCSSINIVCWVFWLSTSTSKL